MGHRYGVEILNWHGELAFAVVLLLGSWLILASQSGAGAALAAMACALTGGWLAMRVLLGTRPFG